MKRRVVSKERRTGDLAQVRFFSYMPGEMAESLDIHQRRAIVKTILHLQEQDPRILEEIYMEQPYPHRAHGEWTTWDRVKRRARWKTKTLWLGLLKQKSERRPKTKMSDYVFLMFMSAIALGILSVIFLFLYWIKSYMLGVDMIDGFHMKDLGE